MRIATHGLTKIYDKKYQALDQLTFNVDLNGIFSVIGRNGAGKTTLIRILSTELLPTSGTAFVNNLDVVKDATALRNEIAVVPQEARPLPWLTPLQTVRSYLMWRGYSYRESKERSKDALRSLGLENLEKVKNRKLSGGQKRKLMVATVIASEAPIIFLDEPTTGLDYVSRKEMWEILSRLKKDRLIILTTHYLEEAEILGDRIMILDKGKLADIGSIDELRSKIKFPYVLRIMSDNVDINEDGVEIKRVSNRQTLVYGTASKIYNLVPYLVTNKIKFTVEQASLGNIFEQYVGEEDGGDKNEKEDW
jgi:ABC-type multidrug transport system, ATPase component